ncbi:MAG TPA: NRDE family protein [Myxococcota bacterium]|nr:NRDE family protein [Myxococcota bacterium]
MCTLILLDRVVPHFPLIAATNRDEFFARPAARPALFPASGGRPAHVAPRDLEAGGTWMGVNASGVFVGLTNRPVSEKPQGARSRGLLVLDALGQGSAEAVAAELERQARTHYAPFNLLAADGRETWLIRRTPERQQVRALDPGLHVICNRDPEDPSSEKVRRIEKEVAGIDLLLEPEALRGELFSVLRRHASASNPFENSCVHTAEYGTRSSSVILLGAAHSAYWYADGAPCQSEYRDFTGLLHDLRVVGQV